jgi:hypothetical protein
MRLVSSFIFAAFINLSLADEIYREIDAEGIPSYSSQETPDSDSVKVGAISTYSQPKGTILLESNRSGKPSAKAITAYNARITEPSGYAAIRNNAGSLSLTIVIEPVLSLGHTAQLMMDGAAIQAISGSGTIKLDNLDRGTHQFQIRIKGADGNTIFNGPSTIISLLRSSILH